MRQFDVFANPSSQSRRYAPFVVVLQSELTMTETIVVVAPLVLAARVRASSKLLPRLEVDGRPLVLIVSQLGAIERKVLADPIANVAAARDDIVAALDLLFLGV